MVLSMRGSGTKLQTSEMEEATKFGLMDPSTKVTGKEIRQTVEVD